MISGLRGVKKTWVLENYFTSLCEARHHLPFLHLFYRRPCTTMFSVHSLPQPLIPTSHCLPALPLWLHPSPFTQLLSKIPFVLAPLLEPPLNLYLPSLPPPPPQGVQWERGCILTLCIYIRYMYIYLYLRQTHVHLICKFQYVFKHKLKFCILCLNILCS